MMEGPNWAKEGAVPSSSQLRVAACPAGKEVVAIGEVTCVSEERQKLTLSIFSIQETEKKLT